MCYPGRDTVRERSALSDVSSNISPSPLYVTTSTDSGFTAVTGASQYLSWSVLGHVLSEEQSKDGSDGVSDDGRLTIVQCHHYHRPLLRFLFLHTLFFFELYFESYLIGTTIS